MESNEEKEKQTEKLYNEAKDEKTKTMLLEQLYSLSGNYRKDTDDVIEDIERVLQHQDQENTHQQLQALIKIYKKDGELSSFKRTLTFKLIQQLCLMTNNFLTILTLFKMYQGQSSGGFNYYGNSRGSSKKHAKDMAREIEQKIKMVCEMPSEAEKAFCTKILTQFYNSKAILPDETFQFSYGYNHEETIKKITKFIELLNKTGVSKFLNDFSYIERVIKWLLIFNNPAGQVDQFENIQNLIDKVLGYCLNDDELLKEQTIQVLNVIFNHLKLFNDEQDLVQGQLNLALIINQLPEDQFKVSFRSFFDEIMKLDILKVRNWAKILKNLVEISFRPNICVIIDTVTEYYFNRKQYAHLYYLFNNFVEPVLTNQIAVIYCTPSTIKTISTYYFGFFQVHKQPSGAALQTMHQQLKIMSHNFFVEKQKEFLHQYCSFLANFFEMYKLKSTQKAFFETLTQIINHYEIQIEKSTDSGWNLKPQQIDLKIIEKAKTTDPFLQGYLIEHTKFKGLKNLGHTCYMNVIIQSLFMTIEFREKLLIDYYDVIDETTTTKKNHSTTPGRSQKVMQIKKSAKNNAMFQLQKLFSDLLHSKGYVIAPIDFRKTLPKRFSQSQMEEDTSEFFRYLLAILEQNMKAQNIQNLIKKIFSGEISQLTTCDKCKQDFRKREQFLDLSVNFGSNPQMYKNIKITDMIKNLYQKERFEGDNLYDCDKCGLTEATIEKSIRKLPPYLVITINRFIYNNKTNTRDKILLPVEVEKTINFQKMFKDLSENATAANNYHLYGQIIHTVFICGNKVDTGHYYCEMRENVNNDEWYIFNDKEVTKKTEKSHVLEQFTFLKQKYRTPYVLFYMQKQKNTKTQKK